LSDKVASLFVEDSVWDTGRIGRGEEREAIRTLFNGFKRFPFATTKAQRLAVGDPGRRWQSATVRTGATWQRSRPRPSDWW